MILRFLKLLHPALCLAEHPLGAEVQPVQHEHESGEGDFSLSRQVVVQGHSPNSHHLCQLCLAHTVGGHFHLDYGGDGRPVSFLIYCHIDYIMSPVAGMQVMN